jgi:hypothetical protein
MFSPVDSTQPNGSFPTISQTVKSNMRLIATMLAAVLASGPAAAQSWTEYSYPEDSFTASFPAQPKVESTTQEGPDGRSVDARIYSVQQDHAAFRITIVDLSDAGLDESAVTEHAVKTLSQGGEVKLNIPARINRVYGRQFSIVGADGSHSAAAVFYLNGRLYEIEGKVLPLESDALAIRFQQSLVFMRGVSNRSADANARRGCRAYRDNADLASVPDNCRRTDQGGGRIRRIDRQNINKEPLQ